jgi:hypothetical protein
MILTTNRGVSKEDEEECVGDLYGSVVVASVCMWGYEGNNR